MRNTGVWLTLFLCCVYPLIVHGALTYMMSGAKWAVKIDWDALQEMLPWRRNR